MDYFRNQYLLEFQRAAMQNLMVSWQAVEQRGALMTRRHLQRLTEGVYHFSRRTQSTVELWYPWVSSRPLTLPVFLSINFIARGPLAWHLLLFIPFFNFIRTICLPISTKCHTGIVPQLNAIVFEFFAHNSLRKSATTDKQMALSMVCLYSCKKRSARDVGSR